MPQGSTLFATGFIKAQENKLLTRDRFERMIDAENGTEAFRILLDAGYGAAAGATDPEGLDAMISAELDAAAGTLRELTPDTRLSDLFLLRYDYQNLKAYAKQRMAGREEPEAVSNRGIFPPERMKEALEDSSKGADLPETLRKAAADVNTYLESGADPSMVDNLCDRAYLAEAFRVADASGNPFIRAYFTLQLDDTNILSLLRLSFINAGPAVIRQALIPGGSVSTDKLLAVAELPYEQWAAALARLPGLRDALASLDVCMSHRVSWPFEKWMDDETASLVRKYRSDLFSIQPLLAWYLAKEAEARMIRMILIGKLNRINETKLRERLRASYV